MIIQRVLSSHLQHLIDQRGEMDFCSRFVDLDVQSISTPFHWSLGALAAARAGSSRQPLSVFDKERSAPFVPCEPILGGQDLPQWSNILQNDCFSYEHLPNLQNCFRLTCFDRRRGARRNRRPLVRHHMHSIWLVPSGHGKSSIIIHL